MQRITVETAKLAAEKGYRDNPWEEDYHKTAYQAELQDWLRITYNIYVSVDCTYNGWYSILQTTDGRFIKDCSENRTNKGIWNTYEEAFEVGLQEALKLIKL